MRVLLDVCTPVQVRQALLGHEVHTAVRMGWEALDNGDLLRGAEVAGSDLLVICDKNLRHQQNLTGRRLAILELRTNLRPTLEKHWSLIGGAPENMRPGEYRVLEAP